MGVPGFFGWLVNVIKELKQFKLLKENVLNIILETLKVPVNKFYIDGNCLIHPICFYTLAKYKDDPRISEGNFLRDRMFKNILKYIIYLVSYVRPKEVFLAIDGVAPLAKINQQRKRRFMSVLDTELIDQIKKNHGAYREEIWNNTCISPGTEFMEQLHQFLLKNLKILNTVKGKGQVKITYSSYHTPSEGEHKILQDIKLCNNTLCDVIYGLDADLIFLSLASHKDNIYLLREESQINNKSEKNDSMYEPLNYVSICDFKQAINYKISSDIKSKQNNNDDNDNTFDDDDEFEIEMNEISESSNITTTIVTTTTNDKNDITIEKESNLRESNIPNFVNDFIFVCYLLGNDFLPHLPSIDIKIDGLNILLNCYCDVYIKYKTNLLDVSPEGDTIINNVFFMEFIKLISTYEITHFKIYLPKHLEKLRFRSPQSIDPLSVELWKFNNVTERDDNFLGVGRNEEWKYKYYSRYFASDGNQQEIINKACYKYLEGIVWTTKYYFNKCPSWNYQYPYNYCPFITDISEYLRTSCIDMNVFNFNRQSQKPISALSQLLAVIPPQRNKLLPINYRKLITSSQSLIIDMYPTCVTVDTMNKDQRFKCVPNLPTIDIDRINNAIKNIELTPMEKERNLVQEPIIIK